MHIPRHPWHGSSTLLRVLGIRSESTAADTLRWKKREGSASSHNGANYPGRLLRASVLDRLEDEDSAW